MNFLERAKELLSYDEDTGVFRWKKTRMWMAKAGDVAGSKFRYISIALDRKPYYAHRLAWLFVHGEWPKGEIDHINGDKHDNRIANLRDVDRQKNMQNVRATGVYYIKSSNRWSAQIRSNDKHLHLGTYESMEEAAAAYRAAKRVVHEDCPQNDGPATAEDAKVLPCPSGRQRNNTSGFTGVSFKRARGTYEAHITVAGKFKHVGHFRTAEAAAAAREVALNTWRKSA